MIQSGEIFGIYKVLVATEKKGKDGHRIYRVRCTICGKEFEMLANDFACKSKIRKNCHHDIANAADIVNKKLRAVYRELWRRCYNPKDKSFKYYGGKGIKICDNWFYSPRLFEAWALKHGYKSGLTIDRIDSKKAYAPENCRWVTNSENARHKSSTKYLTIPVTLTLRQWSSLLHRSNHYVSNLILTHGQEYTVKRLSKEIELIASKSESR